MKTLRSRSFGAPHRGHHQFIVHGAHASSVPGATPSPWLKVAKGPPERHHLSTMCARFRRCPPAAAHEGACAPRTLELKIHSAFRTSCFRHLAPRSDSCADDDERGHRPRHGGSERIAGPQRTPTWWGLSGRTSKRPRFPGWRRSRMAPSQDPAAARRRFAGREKDGKGEDQNVNTTG